MRIIRFSISVTSLIFMVLLILSCAIEEDTTEKLAYIANHNASSVTVIDIENAVSEPESAVVTTVYIPSGGTPIKGIAVSPDKEQVFVPHAAVSGDSLWVFSTKDYSLTGPIHTGDYSVAVEVMPDGNYAYVLNNHENTVSIVSTTSHTVVSTVDVGMNPQNLSFSPDGLYAYVTNKGESTVSVIDTQLAIDMPLAAVIRVIAISSDPPKGIAVTPDGLTAFVATASGTGYGNKVAVLDLLRKKEIDTDDDGLNGITPITLYTAMEGAPRAVAITPDGTRAYVTNLYSNPAGDDTVSIIDTESYAVLGEITVGDGPRGIAITSNGKYAIVANAWGDSVSIIDLDTDTVVSTITHPEIMEPTWIAM